MTTTLTINTHILVQEFTVHRAHTVEDAVAWLRQYGEEAKVLAGGTDLLVQMKLERIAVPKVLYIGKLRELQSIHAEHSLTLGALVSFYDLQKAAIIRERYTALYEAARSFTGTQIKVMGSIGGNLCNASPAADSAPPLLVYDAQIRLRAAQGVRTIAANAFFLGPGKTVLAAHELLTEIELPPLLGQEGSAFFKIGRVGADIAKVSVAARVIREHDTIADCKIALGAVAPTPRRAHRAETFLRGKQCDRAAVDEAAQIAMEEIAPITDVRSTAEYRLEAARILVRDAVLTAWKRTFTHGGEY